jgi:hypothetical protein
VEIKKEWERGWSHQYLSALSIYSYFSHTYNLKVVSKKLFSVYLLRVISMEVVLGFGIALPFVWLID